MNRLKLREMLEEARLNDQSRKRIMKTYKDTRNVIRREDRNSEEFWTEAGVKQESNESSFIQHICYGFRIGDGKRMNKRSSNRKRKDSLLSYIQMT